MFDQDDEMTFDVEANDDDTEIALVVRSPSGKKIDQREFIVALERYLHEVVQADIYFTQTSASRH